MNVGVRFQAVDALRPGRYGVFMYPTSSWTASEEVRRLIVAPVGEIFAGMATSETEPEAVAHPRNAPRNMLDPKQAK